MRVESDWHSLGQPNAPVTIVEFTDLECPFCRRFRANTFPAIKAEYIDTGKVRFVSRDLPLKMHPNAFKAAEAARCAGDQEKFWKFRDAVLTTNGPPTIDAILAQAPTVGVDLPSFRTCLDSDKYKGAIEKDQEGAAALGIRGTPAFVIGGVSNGWLDGVLITGSRPFPVFQEQIDRQMKDGQQAAAIAKP